MIIFSSQHPDFRLPQFYTDTIGMGIAVPGTLVRGDQVRLLFKKLDNNLIYRISVFYLTIL